MFYLHLGHQLQETENVCLQMRDFKWRLAYQASLAYSRSKLKLYT